MTTDELLGRSFTFYAHGRYIVKHHVEVVAFDPQRGLKLAGSGFSPAWIQAGMWKRLLREGVLVAR